MSSFVRFLLLLFDPQRATVERECLQHSDHRGWHFCNHSRLRTKPAQATTDEHKLTQIKISNQSVFIRVHLWFKLRFSKCRERLRIFGLSKVRTILRSGFRHRRQTAVGPGGPYTAHSVARRSNGKLWRQDLRASRDAL